MALIPRKSTAIHAKGTEVAYYVPEHVDDKTQRKIDEHVVMGVVHDYDESRNVYGVRIPSWQLISVAADNCYDPQNDSMVEIPKDDPIVVSDEKAAPEKPQEPEPFDYSKPMKIAIAVILLVAIVYGVRWVNGIKPSENAPTGLNEAVEALNRENLEDVPLLNERSELISEIEAKTKRKLEIEADLRKNKEDKAAALKIINSFRK